MSTRILEMEVLAEKSDGEKQSGVVSITIPTQSEQGTWWCEIADGIGPCTKAAGGDPLQALSLGLRRLLFSFSQFQSNGGKLYRTKDRFGNPVSELIELDVYGKDSTDEVGE